MLQNRHPSFKHHSFEGREHTDIVHDGEVVDLIGDILLNKHSDEQGKDVDRCDGVECGTALGYAGGSGSGAGS